MKKRKASVKREFWYSSVLNMLFSQQIQNGCPISTRVKNDTRNDLADVFITHSLAKHLITPIPL